MKRKPLLVFVCCSVLLRLLANVGQDATINIQYVAIDGVRSVRSQEDSRTAQLRRIEPAAGRCLGADERIEGMTAAVRLTLTKGSGLGSGDVAWANAVTLDVVLSVLRADVAGEHLQATLGGSVG